MNGRQRREWLSSAFWQLAIVFLVAFWWIVATVIYAMAHDAKPTAAQPYGWSYPVYCCSGKDCTSVSDKTVTEGPDGYTITLTPEQHQMLKQTTTFRVAYGDTKVKDSPDQDFHVCISQQHLSPDGTAAFGGTLLCFFVPPRGY